MAGSEEAQQEAMEIKTVFQVAINDHKKPEVLKLRPFLQEEPSAWGKPKLLGLSRAGKQKGSGTGGGHEGSREHGRSSSPHLPLPQGATTRTSSKQKDAHLALPTVLQSSQVGMENPDPPILWCGCEVMAGDGRAENSHLAWKAPVPHCALIP